MKRVWLIHSQYVATSGQYELKKIAAPRCLLITAFIIGVLFTSSALQANNRLDNEAANTIDKTLLAAGQGSTKKIARRNALFKLNSKWQSMTPNALSIEMDDERLSFNCSKKLIWSCLATLNLRTAPSPSATLQNDPQSAKLSVNRTHT